MHRHCPHNSAKVILSKVNNNALHSIAWPSVGLLILRSSVFLLYASIVIFTLTIRPTHRMGTGTSTLHRACSWHVSPRWIGELTYKRSRILDVLSASKSRVNLQMNGLIHWNMRTYVSVTQSNMDAETEVGNAILYYHANKIDEDF